MWQYNTLLLTTGALYPAVTMAMCQQLMLAVMPFVAFASPPPNTLQSPAHLLLPAPAAALLLLCVPPASLSCVLTRTQYAGSCGCCSCEVIARTAVWYRASTSGPGWWSGATCSKSYNFSCSASIIC